MNASGTLSFLWLSDVHYDPYYGQQGALERHEDALVCSLSNASSNGFYGCDSPWELVRDAIDAAGRLSDGRPSEFILISGDYARHGMEKTDDPMLLLPDILRNVTAHVQEDFDGIPILPILGNNDVVPDYYLDILSTYDTDSAPSMLGVISGVFEETGVLSSEEADMFRRGGYYKRQFGNITMLCLNTVLYSISHSPDLPDYNSDPLDQFTWLERELQNATAAYVIGHIPPTIDSFMQSDMWKEPYRALYASIVSKYAKTIQGQFFGHFHTDEFRLMDSLPLFIGPSITPVYRNNPSFRVVHFEPDTGAVEDIDTYVLNLTAPIPTNSTGPTTNVSSNWTKLYSYREAYGLKDMTSKSLERNILEPIIGTSAGIGNVLHDFVYRYKGGMYGSKKAEACRNNTGVCRVQWFCTLRSSTRKDFKICTRAHRFHASTTFGDTATQNDLSTSTKLLLGLVVVLFVALLFVYPCFKGHFDRRRNLNYDTSSVRIEMVSAHDEPGYDPAMMRREDSIL